MIRCWQLTNGKCEDNHGYLVSLGGVSSWWGQSILKNGSARDPTLLSHPDGIWVILVKTHSISRFDFSHTITITTADYRCHSSCCCRRHYHNLEWDDRQLVIVTAVRCRTRVTARGTLNRRNARTVVRWIVTQWLIFQIFSLCHSLLKNKK